MTNVTHFPTLADPGALIDEFVPQMVDLLNRPHHEHDEEWWSLRDQLDGIFTEHGWAGDESRVAFDLLIEFANREITE
jgi:hypothetical protein